MFSKGLFHEVVKCDGILEDSAVFIMGKFLQPAGFLYASYHIAYFAANDATIIGVIDDAIIVPLANWAAVLSAYASQGLSFQSAQCALSSW